MPRRTSPRDCARALWLLGIEPPVTPAQLQAAYRARIAQAHPDLHLDSEARTEAANVLSRAINEARDLVSDWIAADRDWPALAGSRAASRATRLRPIPCPLRSAAARGCAPATSCACGRTTAMSRSSPGPRSTASGLGDPARSRRGASRPGDARRLPVPGVRPVRRPGRRAAACCDRAPTAWPTCAPSSAGRTRRAGCEAPSRPARRRASPRRACSATSGSSSAPSHAAAGRGGLRRAGPDDLRAALVSAFTNAFDRWTAPV